MALEMFPVAKTSTICYVQIGPKQLVQGLLQPTDANELHRDYQSNPDCQSQLGCVMSYISENKKKTNIRSYGSVPQVTKILQHIQLILDLNIFKKSSKEIVYLNINNLCEYSLFLGTKFI